MRVTLKVLKGASEGKTIEVKVPQFIIGRSSGCQLRPQSDAISRRHCVILLNESGATIRDLGSRNGTIVNGEKITGETKLATDDEVRIGPFYLQVLMTSDQVVVAETPAPVAAKAPNAVTRIDVGGDETLSRKTSDSGLISDWLAEPDSVPSPVADSTISTRQFKLDETERIELKKASEEAEEAKAEADAKASKKREPGKLPTREKDKTANSQEAAEQTLRRMFNRGL